MMLYPNLIEHGGPIMWIIVAGAVLQLFIFLKKVFQFHREEINVRDFLRGLFNALKRNGYVEAITLCDNTPGPVARILGAAILARERGDEDIRRAIDEAALEEIPKLERHVQVLSTVAFVMPLLGFVGTVLGMMKAFQTVSDAGQFFSAATITGAVNSALITTAAALVTAIPAYIAYNYLVARIQSITLDMEKAALEILNFFENTGREKAK